MKKELTPIDIKLQQIYSPVIETFNEYELLKVIVTKEKWDENYIAVAKKRYLKLINQ